MNFHLNIIPTFHLFEICHVDVLQHQHQHLHQEVHQLQFEGVLQEVIYFVICSDLIRFWQ